MQRLYWPNELLDHLVVDDDKTMHQIVSVLRSKAGDGFVFFCGDGVDVRYELVEIAKRHLVFRKVSESPCMGDPSVQLHLVQSMPNKWEKIEFILQKGVEVGIASFTFVRSDRSQALPFSESKIERMRSVAREALEQSGGNAFPDIRFLDGKIASLIESVLPESSVVLDTVE